ncbi:MAG: DUF5011 domain-containing protein [Bacteroidia bacterium]
MLYKSFKYILIVTLLCIIISCNNDVKAPEIILNGKINDTIELNTKYEEPGFVAKDKKDGDLTDKVIVNGSVNINKTGNYIIRYEVIDKSGNMAKAERSVYVINKANYLEGNYQVNEIVKGANPGQFNYTVKVKSSETQNQQIEINNFGSYGVYVNVKAQINGNNISIPLQNPSGMPIGSEGTISGNGEIKNNNIYSIEFICSYFNGGIDTVSCIYTKL